ncbi:MAG: GNAT family N-acetyltransferase [Planctomycetes bacterium]|nr:GNAT family N-acetyltransferase [Planctomycetota bacterium]
MEVPRAGVATRGGGGTERWHRRSDGEVGGRARRGRGVAARLVRALRRIAAAQGTGVWCNARAAAVAFYQGCGFRPVGPVFELPDIGPHSRMEWAGPAPPE